MNADLEEMNADMFRNPICVHLLTSAGDPRQRVICVPVFF